MKFRNLLAITFILILGCRQTPDLSVIETSKRGLITEKAMVVSARVEASRIGNDILASGGNAFDAMVATELALAVAYPVAGNIGGGGFMMLFVEPTSKLDVMAALSEFDGSFYRFHFTREGAQGWSV